MENTIESKPVIIPNTPPLKIPQSSSSSSNNIDTKMCLSFLSSIYVNLFKRSKNLFNMYTLYELCSFPMIICNKIFKVFSGESNPNNSMTKEHFIQGFYTLYFGSLEEKTMLISRIFDFASNGTIWINDIKLLLLHFHMHLLTNTTESQVLNILNAFFNDESDKKNDYVITVNDFYERSMKSNGDLVYIFITFIEKLSFFNSEQLRFYKNVSEFKEKDHDKERETMTIPFELISLKTVAYVKMVNDAMYNEDPFDDDSESLSNLATFESDVTETMSTFNNQIDYTVKNSYEEPLSEQQRNLTSFSAKAKEFFIHRTNSKAQTFKINYNNPLKNKHTNKYPQHELIVYRQSAKTKKMKLIKFVQVGQMIFYHKYNQSAQVFEYKKLIMIRLLFPRIIPNTLLPNGTYYLLELQSSIHNTLRITNYYTQNEEELTSFVKELNAVQRIKNIEEDYELGEQLGNGKFGKVLYAKHILSGMDVAIKMVSKCDNEHSEETFHSYKWEKDICMFLKNVTCEYIEKCYDILETPTYLYYITEYISGGSLKGLINETNGLSSHDLNDVTIQMIKGVSVLHQYGIIHRDIKHTNTLINKTAKGRLVIKFIDFGLSKVMGVNETAGEHYGSLSFKAPELILGKQYSFGVDVWALGVTIYFLLFQTFPAKASNKHQLKKKIVNMNYSTQLFDNKIPIDPFIGNIISRCLVKDPKKRFSINKLLRNLNKKDENDYY